MNVVIDFEDLPEDSLVTTQYQKKGVIFDGPIVADQDDGATPHSGLQYVMYFLAEFQQTPTTATFRFPKGQKRVKLWAGSLPGDPPSYGLFVAYDALGTQIASDGPHKLTPGACAVPFEVKAAPNVITKVALSGYDGFAAGGFPLFPHLVVDDLELEADPQPMPGLAMVEPILTVGMSDTGLVMHPVGSSPEPPGGPFGRSLSNVIVGLLAIDNLARRKGVGSRSQEIRRVAIQSAIAELEHLLRDQGRG